MRSLLGALGTAIAGAAAGSGGAEEEEAQLDAQGLPSKLRQAAEQAVGRATGGAGAANDAVQHTAMLREQMLHQELEDHHAAQAHEQLHAHHMHLNGPHHAARHGTSTGLIWLLVFLHLGFIGYWLWVYYKQQRARAKKEGRKEPERVNCVYEFALPTINLPGLGMGASEKRER